MHLNDSKLVRGALAHLVADWLLQTDWIARNKSSLNHPAAWTHGAIVAVTARSVYSWPVALSVALAHVAIDSRRPLRWWFRLTSGGAQQCDDGTRQMVGVTCDQVLHGLVLAVASMERTEAGNE